jgi:hypothetical protein
MHEFQVNKVDFTQSRLVENQTLTADSVLAENEVIVEIESFALTANNITYAVMGDRLNYWQFFPASNNEENVWGIIPVWGFAKVVASKCSEIPVGEKIFGYFPPASLLKITATNITPERLIDGSPHRHALAAGYNIYRRTNAEANYDAQLDAQRSLLFPLHITSYCLWDYLRDKNWFEAEQVIIISASSKTSIGLAYGIHLDDSSPKSVGITSTRNNDFVNQLGIYQQVLNYHDIAQLDASLKTVIVDMAGNAQQLKAIEQHLDGNLQYCIQVGLTHWDASPKERPLKNTPSEMFFAPGHIQNKIAQIGAQAFEKSSMDFIAKNIEYSKNWLEVKCLDGLAAMNDIYPQVCNGKVSPELGIIIKP